MFLVQIKNIFVEKNIFCLIFLFRHQFFHRYKTFNLNTWGNTLNFQKQTKNVHKFKKILCSLKKNTIQKNRQDGEYEKGKIENMVRRSD